MRWCLIWGCATLLLVSGVSGCESGRGFTPSPVAPSAAENRLAPQTATPFSIPTEIPEVVEGKPTVPGTEIPWTPPPTLTLPPLRTSWQVHELPEVGVRLQVPHVWNALRNPGGYLFTANGDYRIQVTQCCIELPRTLPEFQKAIVSYWHTLHAQDFLVMPLQGKGWQGVAVWHLPNICLDIYIPSPEIVRQITFWPILCKPDRAMLLPLGQLILDSVEVFPPKGEWK